MKWLLECDPSCELPVACYPVGDDSKPLTWNQSDGSCDCILKDGTYDPDCPEKM